MNKKIFAILIVLICALSISAVSASEDVAVADGESVTDVQAVAVGSDDTNNINPIDAEATTIDLDSVSNVTVGKDVTIYGTVKNVDTPATIPTGNVIIKVADKTVNADINSTDGTFSANITLPAGVYNATVSYAGDETYLKSNKTTDNFKVTKNSTSITITNIDKKIDVGGNLTINGTTTAIPAGSNLTVSVNGKIVKTTVKDNKFGVKINNITSEGTTKVTVSYEGTDALNASSATANVTVGKNSSSITFNPITATVGQNVTVTGNTVPDAANFTITIDGKVFNVTSAAGTFSINIGNFGAGNKTMIVKYLGNENYTAYNTTVTFNVPKIATSISVSDVSILVGQNATIGGTVTGIPTNSTITITLNNKTYNVKVNGTTFSLTVKDLAAGSYNITAIYAGNANYNAANTTANLEVTKNPTVTTIVTITNSLQAGDRLIVNATVTSNSSPINGTAILLINGKQITTAKVINGKVNFNTTINAGNRTVMVKFAADNKYASSNATAPVTVQGLDANLTVPGITLYFKNGTALIIYLTANGTNVSGEKVTILINGEEYTRTITNGTARFPINLAPGTYVVNVTLDSARYNLISTTANVTVLPVVKGNDTVLFFRNGTRYVALFLDGQGKPLAGAKVQFNINGVLYDRTTNGNGTASIAINLAAGNYTITAINTNNNAMNSNNITVLPVVKGNDTVLFFRNGTRYVALFLDGQGKPLAGAKVQFNINGVFYDRTTNGNGTASIAINLAPGSYVITAINTNNSAMNSNNITVLPTIISENFSKYYKNGTQYVVQIVDGQGNALANKTVTYNINGVFYTRTTNANGTATFPINLAAGNSVPQEYVITASCNNCTISNTITVLPVLTAQNFNEPQGAGKGYAVTAVDGQGKPLAGAKIQFNINGVFYNRTTNANGTATLPINLGVGEYTITATCLNNTATISNKVTVSPKV